MVQLIAEFAEKAFSFFFIYKLLPCQKILV